MVPIRDSKIVEAAHEPPARSGVSAERRNLRLEFWMLNVSAQSAIALPRRSAVLPGSSPAPVGWSGAEAPFEQGIEETEVSIAAIQRDLHNFQVRVVQQLSGFEQA